MRRAIIAFAMVAGMVAAAQPAGAIDDGFQGDYRVRARMAHQDATNLGCGRGNYTRLVYVHYVSQQVRQFGDPDTGAARRFRYRPEKPDPWHHVRGVEYMLRYDPKTDTALGSRHAHHCVWNVSLVPIG